MQYMVGWAATTKFQEDWIYIVIVIALVIVIIFIVTVI